MTNRIASLIFVVVSALFLAACLDMKTTYDIKSKEDVTMTMRVAIENKAMEALQQTQPQMKEAVCQNMSNDKMQMTTKKEGGDTVCQIAMQTKFNVVEMLINQQEEQNGFEQSIKKLDDNSYRYDLTFAFSDLQKKEMEGKTEIAAQMRDSFKGRKMIVEFKAPKILKTNGKMAADKKSASIIIEMDKMIGADAKPFSKFIEFKL